MFGKSVSTRLLKVLLCAALFSTCPLPGLAAPTPTELVDAITAAKVLPASVKVNAQYSMGQVLIYMYRSSKVPDDDLKIDSVLITKALKDKFGKDVKSVQLNFYDSANQRSVRQCTVSQAHVESFASRQITQQQLLDFLTVNRTTAGGSSGSGSVTNANLEAVLAAKWAQGYKEDARGRQLLDIKEIARKGGNYQKLFATFRQMDDMIKQGKTEEIIPIYNELSSQITVEIANCNQRAAAADSDAALKAREATTKALMLSYYPRYGFAFRRRVLIWQKIKQLQAAGRDVTYQASYLFEHVDNPLLSGRLEDVKTGIVQLERVLGIQSSNDW